MITKAKFVRYERVRKSGVTNMFAVNIVSQLSGLVEADITDIINNYSKYRKQFGG